jgi:mitochondrial fission protein ELM1
MWPSTENTLVSAVIWRLLDGRAGHENQVVGLSEAIARCCAVQFCDIYINRSFRGMKSLLPNRLSFAKGLPAPDLLIGAGHSTHLPLLTMQRQFGGKTVVIMKPSLPTMLFDLCLIPAHDNLRFPHGNVIRTEGSLNRIQPSTQHDLRQGMILIGGPSRHFAWSDVLLMKQIRDITQRQNLDWTLATSARTPDSFIRAWRQQIPEIPFVESGHCSPQWLPNRLAQCGECWVTCDSMSMIYEALTSGTRVGLLELPAIAHDRISRNIQRLCANGIVMSATHWFAGHKLPMPIKTFSESNRCSAMIIDRLLHPIASRPQRFATAEYSTEPQSCPAAFSERPELSILGSPLLES